MVGLIEDLDEAFKRAKSARQLSMALARITGVTTFITTSSRSSPSCCPLPYPKARRRAVKRRLNESAPWQGDKGHHVVVGTRAMRHRLAGPFNSATPL